MKTNTKPTSFIARRADSDAYLAFRRDPDNFDPTGAFVKARASESDRDEYIKQFEFTFLKLLKNR